MPFWSFLSFVYFSYTYFLKHKGQCCLKSQLCFKEMNVFIFISFCRYIISIGCHFSSAWRIFFTISCSAGLLVMKLFSFCMSKIILFCPFLKDTCTGYIFVGWLFFLSRCCSTVFSFALFLSRILLSSFLYSSVCNVPFFSGCF